MTDAAGVEGDDASFRHTPWNEVAEAVWAYRAGIVERLIAEGDRHPFRLVRRLSALERRTELAWDAKAGAVIPRPIAYPVQELAPDGCPPFIRLSLRGECLTVPFHSRCAPVVDFIISYLETNGPYDALIELGCGCGQTLIELYYSGGPKDIPYWGGEGSASGRRLANRLAALDSDFPGRFFPFDPALPKLGGLPAFERPLFFTAQSLARGCRIGPEFFEGVAKAAPRVCCLHFEPFGVQLSSIGEIPASHRRVTASEHRNLTLGPALRQAALKSLIKIEYAATEIFFSPDPTNPTSLAIWSARS